MHLKPKGPVAAAIYSSLVRLEAGVRQLSPTALSQNDEPMNDEQLGPRARGAR